jgi:hypothetical protein
VGAPRAWLVIGRCGPPGRDSLGFPDRRDRLKSDWHRGCGGSAYLWHCVLHVHQSASRQITAHTVKPSPFAVDPFRSCGVNRIRAIIAVRNIKYQTGFFHELHSRTIADSPGVERSRIISSRRPIFTFQSRTFAQILFGCHRVTFISSKSVIDKKQIITYLFTSFLLLPRHIDALQSDLKVRILPFFLRCP